MEWLSRRLLAPASAGADPNIPTVGRDVNLQEHARNLGVVARVLGFVPGRPGGCEVGGHRRAPVLATPREP